MSTLLERKKLKDNELKEMSLEEIIFLKRHKDFVNGLLKKFDSQKVTEMQYISNLKLFNNLSEYKKKQCMARLNRIVDNSSPLSYAGPMLTYLFLIINFFGIFLTFDYKDTEVFYFIMIFINIFFLILILIGYQSDKSSLSKCKYLLNLLKE